METRIKLSRAIEALQRSGQLIRLQSSVTLPDTPGVVYTDSRHVSSGSIFLAYRGVTNDGHKHIGSAIKNGAALLVVEDTAEIPPDTKTPFAVVKNGRFAWAYLAAEAHDNPQNHLKMLAVMGTNGKTSTAWMVHALLKASGKRSLLIGTLGAWIGDSFRKTNHTTPDPDLLYALLAEARDNGIGVVVMEAASQSLLHGKLAPIVFSGAAFTSFSRDHLDLHQTMDDYFAAKLALFQNHLSDSARVVLSKKVPLAGKFDFLKQRDKWCYEQSATVGELESIPAGFRQRTCTIVSTDPNGTSLQILDDGKYMATGKIPYAGDFFVENFCAALLLTEEALGHSLAPDLWSDLPPVPGRLERVQLNKGRSSSVILPAVLVDYAHTPDALEKALTAVRPLTRGKLVVVFGCGGDRDRGKRPQMGALAARLADFSFITSDNPRTESIDQILRDVVAGVESEGGRKDETFQVIADRRAAIFQAIASSRAGDLVLVAGKGHEDYQIIGTASHSFDDRKVAMESLSAPRQWLIIGGGVSGLGAAQLLRTESQAVRLSEAKLLKTPMREAFLAAGVEICDGGHTVEHLKEVDAVVVSPGVPESHLLLQEAKRSSVSIISEIDLAMHDYAGQLIGITGTNGKSTTTVMIGHLLTKLGLDFSMGGNLGDPPSAIRAKRTLPGIVALELSSYQLEQSTALRPAVSIFTSFSHDHMARHGSLEAYFAAKWKLFAASSENSLSIVTHDVLTLARNFHMPEPPGTLLIADKLGVDLSSAGISEKHNLLNATFALFAVAKVSGKPVGDLCSLLKDFRGLPHRCELIGTIGNKPIINDSKSTNVESTMVAIESQPGPLVLMMGGQGKGEPYSPLLKSLSGVARLVTFGASGNEIGAALSASVPTTKYLSLAEALKSELPKVQKQPMTLLFSPGCASFDEFNNYEHRGEFFKESCRKFLDS